MHLLSDMAILGIHVSFRGCIGYGPLPVTVESEG